MFNTSKSDKKTGSILEQVSKLREKGEYSKAESLLLNHIDTESEQEEYVQSLMQLQFIQGKGSVEFLNSYAFRFPNYFSLQRDIVGMFLELGELEKAQEKMAQNFEVFGESSELWTDNGVIFRHLGDRNKAEIYFQRAISMNPKSSNSWFNWGNLYMDEGRYAQAEQFYLRAIRIDDKNLETWIQLIYSVIAREEFVIALRFVSFAKIRVGEFPIFFYLQSLIFFHQKKIKEAKWSIHLALQNGNEPIFWELLICLLKEENLDTTEAEKFLKELV